MPKGKSPERMGNIGKNRTVRELAQFIHYCVEAGISEDDAT